MKTVGEGISQNGGIYLVHKHFRKCVNHRDYAASRCFTLGLILNVAGRKNMPLSGHGLNLWSWWRNVEEKSAFSS